ncbi:MAG: SMC-Scp complex subunit ScpB [Patescibacteria group bacterium]|jgi:segregation and condensation protein B
MKLKQQLESVLFVCSKFLKKSKLKEILNCKEEELKAALAELSKEYETRESGLALMQDGDRVQMITSPQCSEIVRQYIKDERTGELTRPSLETLAIISYRGPITKADIEMIRGVNCSLILRNLMIRGLVAERQDKKKGVPVYQVTFEFMQHLGLKELKELPDFEKLNRELKLGEVLLAQNKNKEDFFQDLEKVEEKKHE